MIEAEPEYAEALFGGHIDAARDFARELATRGEELGLIGPLEAGRLWTRCDPASRETSGAERGSPASCSRLLAQTLSSCWWNRWSAGVSGCVPSRTALA
jgi:hypothetical protein